MTNAVYFQFPAETELGPGEYFVVADKPDDFSNRYGFAVVIQRFSVFMAGVIRAVIAIFCNRRKSMRIWM